MHWWTVARSNLFAPCFNPFFIQKCVPEKYFERSAFSLRNVRVRAESTNDHNYRINWNHRTREKFLFIYVFGPRKMNETHELQFSLQFDPKICVTKGICGVTLICIEWPVAIKITSVDNSLAPKPPKFCRNRKAFIPLSTIYDRSLQLVCCKVIFASISWIPAIRM